MDKQTSKPVCVVSGVGPGNGAAVRRGLVALSGHKQQIKEVLRQK